MSSEGPPTRRIRAPSHPEEEALLAALGVLGGSAPLRLTAEVAGLDDDRAARIADELIAAGVLESGRPLRPARRDLLDQALDELAPSARAQLHRRAAAALISGHAAPAAVAHHLLACDPAADPAAVAVLRDAASEAVKLGDAPRAVAYLERALAEPPERADLGSVLTELGRALFRAGRPGAASPHLRRALGLAADDEALARAARHLGRARVRANDLSEAVATYEDAIARMGPESHDIRYGLEAEFVALSPTAIWVYDRIIQRVEQAGWDLPGNTPNERALLAVVEELLVINRGTAAEAARLGQQPPAGDNHRGSAGPALAPIRAIWMLLRAESFGAAASGLEHTLQRHRRIGDDADIALLLALRAQLHLQTGALAAAAADAEEALRLAASVEWALPLHSAGAMLTEALTELGDLDGAERVLRDEVDLDAVEAPSFSTTQLIQSRGTLRLVQGRIDEGVADLMLVGHHRRQIGVSNPSGWPWVSRVVPALMKLGREDEARTLAVDNLAAAERWGAPATLAAALGARARSLPADEAAAHVRAALDVLGNSQAILVRWRLRLQHAALELARGRREAAAESAKSIALAARNAGAALIAAQADRLAAAAGQGPDAAVGRLRDLSPRELQVARLVAVGMTDKQIAEALVISPRTVQSHVGSALRKTGAGTRTELAAMAIYEGLAGPGSADD